MCITWCLVCLWWAGGRHRENFSTHAVPFLMIFASSSLSCFVALLFCGVTRKTAINIECHVGCYDVLIDCLTTNRFEAISTKQSRERHLTRSQEIFFWHLFDILLLYYATERHFGGPWCMMTLIGFIMTSVCWLLMLLYALWFMRWELGNGKICWPFVVWCERVFIINR